jgi:hypothetical protein
MAQGGENRFYQGSNINVGIIARGIGIIFALATMPPLFALGTIEAIKESKNKPPASQPISPETVSPKR